MAELLKVDECLGIKQSGVVERSPKKFCPMFMERQERTESDRTGANFIRPKKKTFCQLGQENQRMDF